MPAERGNLILALVFLLLLLSVEKVEQHRGTSGVFYSVIAKARSVRDGTIRLILALAIGWTAKGANHG